MAIIPDPRQIWLTLPEPVLRFAAPLPDPLPEWGSDACRSASPEVRRAAWAYHRDVEVDLMNAACVALCNRWEVAKAAGRAS